MPLPPSDTKKPWPPPEWQPVFLHMRQWSAWYTGDLQTLQSAYGGGDIQDDTGFFASDHGGFLPTVGRTLQRWFVGEPTRGPERLNKIPVPIGSELCTAGADLLFSDPPTITMGLRERKQKAAAKAQQAATQADQQAHKAQSDALAGKAPQTPPQSPPAQVETDPGDQRLQEFLDDEFWSRISQAAELGGALGGTYLITTWDPIAVKDRPFTTVKDADCALPEFQWGMLKAVTFWRVVKRVKDGREVWRHLERHELVGDDGGSQHYVIQHGLYLGTDTTLGVSMPLDQNPVTAPLLLNPDIGMGGVIATPFDRLMVTYVPNTRPNRLWRALVVGCDLGRSDLSGIEHLMDQLAECVSAWMRAIRLSKARIFIAKSLLKNAGPGQGQVADLEQEAFTTLDGIAGRDQPLSQQINMVQPEVKWEQYSKTAEMLLEQIVLQAGYSSQTFGIGDKGNIRTATEIEARERRTLLTRDRKIREWRPGLKSHIENLMIADQQFFAGPGLTGEIDVAFPDGVQETQLSLAQTVVFMQQSESASLKTRVAALHPDWEDDDVIAEVQSIQAEARQNMQLLMPPDPMQSQSGFGGSGGGQPD